VYLFHRDRKLAIKTQYDDCPVKCLTARKQWDYARREYCDGCEHKKEQRAFRDEADSVFEQRFGEPCEDFHDLYNKVVEIAGLEKKRHLSVYATALLNTFLNERYKYDRYKEAQKPPV
jgi:hypothetical protein